MSIKILLSCAVIAALVDGCGESESDQPQSNWNDPSGYARIDKPKSPKEDLARKLEDAKNRISKLEGELSEEKGKAEGLEKRMKAERAANDTRWRWTISVMVGIVLVIVAFFVYIGRRRPVVITNHEADELRKCPRCGWKYIEGETKCRNCGTRF